MSEITNQPLYLIKFDDTEVPDETVFGAEVANKRFEQISGNWNAHLFVKVASNSRDDSCSGSNAKLASDYDALAAQRDEGLAREAELKEKLHKMTIARDSAWRLYEASRNRLAEAEKAKPLIHLNPQVVEAIQRNYPLRGGLTYSLSEPIGNWTVPLFLAGPGGACIKKSPAPALNLPRRKVKTEYSTAEEDAQADAWNAALDAVQELNK